MILSKLKRAIRNPREVGLMLVNLLAPIITNDKVFLSLKYRVIFGKKLNWETPKTFSEKLQWLKVYDRNPQYTVLVDKIKVKEYVAEKLGEEYIIPTLGTWEHPEDIDFDSLPEKFVLKCNHNSGLGMYICKDKSKMDKDAVIRELNKGLKEDYYKLGREWPYKNVPRRILAEKFIETDPNINDLIDYKFFCFDGKPKYCQVIAGRNSVMSIDFFDEKWNHQSFHEPKIFPFAIKVPSKPKCLDMMWKAAKLLAEGKPFSRIDFYEVNNKIYFGEITFFPTSGFGGFSPEEYDMQFGSLIPLPLVHGSSMITGKSN